MTLTEKFITDAIHLDAGADIMYGSDQMYDSYPISFPTVEFQLTATDALAELADGIRLEKGCKPIFPRDGSTDDVDNDGWYLSAENSYPHHYQNYRSIKAELLIIMRIINNSIIVAHISEQGLHHFSIAVLQIQGYLE